VQGPIHEEQTLKNLIRSAMSSGTPEALDELHDYTRKTAAGLAALHRSGVDYGETVTWEDELAEIRELSARLGAAIPRLADAAAPLLARLEALAPEYPADPLGPAHRSFRPAQVLLHNGQIGFIDFDGFCQAEPAMDLALFMAEIKSLGLSKSHRDKDDEAMDQETRLARIAQLEALCEAFLDEYTARAPVSRQRIMLWESLDLLNVVMGSWTKIKPERIYNTMFLLERHIRASGLNTE
jgi:aminoglycoside phosphotransferase (APT) family kinase protein